jgi:hypothetical protein
MLVFLHIEKTGGGSLISSLENSGIKVARPMHRDDTKGAVHRVPTPEECQASGAQVYESHFDPLFINAMSIKYPVYTLIREPVARTISHVKFLYQNRHESYVTSDPGMIFMQHFRPDSLDCWRLAFRHCPYLADLQCRRLLGHTYKAKIKETEISTILNHPNYHIYPLWRIGDIYRDLGGKDKMVTSGVSDLHWSLPVEVLEFIRSMCPCDTILWNTVNAQSRSSGYLD